MTAAGRKLRFGIVGCGVVGPVHARALAGLSAEAELVAVADVMAERAQAVAARHDARVYSSLADMLAREALDVVNVCTESGRHAEHACAAMRAGAHVIIEKPMEIRRDRLDEILAVQEQTGRKVAVISQHRFDDDARRVHDLAARGELGRLVMASAAGPWWRSQEYYDRGGWRGTWELDGGGVLMNQCIHSVDLLQWLMGRVVAVTAYAAILAHRMAAEDVVTIILRFANGALGTIAATTGAYPGVTTRVELFGDAGSAILEMDRLAYLSLRSEPGAGGYRTPAETKGGTFSDPAGLDPTSHMRQIADMIRAVREDGTPLMDGREGRRPVDIVLAAYDSARTGREVAIP